MRNLCFFLCFISMLKLEAQFTLEHTYDSAATYNVASSRGSQLMIVKFEVSGERYVKINRAGFNISVYDLNHSLLKTIPLSGFPLIAPYNTVGDILYFSEHLFNLDAKMEFMYCYSYTDGGGNGQFVTRIYNEDGLILFADTSIPNIRMNVPLQQYPIYNTTQGTKMILSCTNGKARVFSVQGTLTTAIQAANAALISSGSWISGAYPNPSNQSTAINYQLPPGIEQGEIVIFDVSGKEIKRFKVDRTFTSLNISTNDIAAGTYYYRLQTTMGMSEGKKVVVQN